MRWKGIPLSKLSLRRGQWSFSEAFSEVATAKAWGVRPTELRGWPEEDRVLAMGYERAIAMMQAWEVQEAEKEAEQARRKAGHGKHG